MHDPNEKIVKLKVEAEVELDEGEKYLGFLFVKHMQRVSDLLNDHRQFLPFQLTDGRVLHLQKTKIVRVCQLAQEGEPEEAMDPFEILGVSPSASDQQLKESYHNLCSDFHPDKLQGLGLPPEFSDIANSRIVRIIDAYRRIMKGRHVANGEDRDSPFSPVP